MNVNRPYAIKMQHVITWKGHLNACVKQIRITLETEHIVPVSILF